MPFLNSEVSRFSPSHTRRETGYEVVVAFDYYDGPERGLALFPSGEGVRFSSLGDSRSRMFRAFELESIGGNWWRQVRALQAFYGVTSSHRVLCPSGASEPLSMLEIGIVDAVATGRHIGVGSPNFEWMLVSDVTDEELKLLRELSPSLAGFNFAHQIVKGLRAG